LPQDWLREMRRTEEIRSYRDKNLEDAKKAIAGWMVAVGKKSWVHEEAKDIHLWRSAGRLAAMVIRWRQKRVDGDAEIFALLEEWRKRDRHLYEFEANLRDQLIGRRMSIYRNFAAALRRKYHTAVLKKMDYRKLHELPEAEEPGMEKGLKTHSRDAALSLLERCIKESVSKTVEVNPKDTSRIHSDCGSKEDPVAGERFNTCGSCGDLYDVDENAAENLLKTTKGRRSSAVLA
jgi:hypothetical protein